jgi:hypothetical protein
VRAVAAALGLLVLAALPARAVVVFGDLHAHSGVSVDGSNPPDAFFTVARDVVGLDFVMLTDHDLFRVPADFDVVKATAASFNEDGKFLAIPGMEWTRFWHMNVYYQRDDEPYCVDCTVQAFNSVFGARVDAGEAGAHVNHPGPPYVVSWEEIDDSVTTNVEVYNADSAPEYEFGFGRALWALRAGMKLGLVGVSDEHHTDEADNVLGKGLTGCSVDSLTRANVLAELRARRCWATSGERITADLSANGVGMGGEITATIGDTVPVTVEAMGTSAPVRLELVVDGETVAQQDCTTPGCVLAASPVKVTDLRHVVYGRVIQQPNDEKAWTSPIWIEAACASDDKKCARRGWVRGGGPKKSDCLHEWRAAAKATGTRISCRDGDPRCDEGTTDEECTFHVGFCTSHERLRGCTPAALTGWELSSPSEMDAKGAQLENRRTLQAAARALGNPPAAGCTPLFDLNVPLDVTNGRPRTTAATFVASAVAGGLADRDTLTLRCLPGRRKRAASAVE